MKKLITLIGLIGLMNICFSKSIQYYNYNLNQIYKVKTAAGLLTTISFPNSEIITYYNVGYPEAWTIEQPKGTNFILLKPASTTPESNLLIRTKDKKGKIYSYLFLLYSDQKEWKDPATVNYNFAIRLLNPLSADKKKSSKMSKQVSDADLEEYSVDNGYKFSDYDYRETLNANFLVPYQIWDNGVITFIVFKEGAPRPSIYSYENKKEKLLNYTPLENGQIVLHGVYSNILLRMDDDVVELRRNTTIKSDNHLKTNIEKIRVNKELQ